MAHASCINGHDLWNGDGEPVFNAFRIDYIKSFTELHPNVRLNMHYVYSQIYNCCDEVPYEDLDIWYCDECGSFFIYYENSLGGNERVDYCPVDKISENMETSDWIDYVALQDAEMDEFATFYEGMSPYEAIVKYQFKYRCKVSPDYSKILIYVNGNLKYYYSLKKKYVFDSDWILLSESDLEVDNE